MFRFTLKKSLKYVNILAKDEQIKLNIKVYSNILPISSFKRYQSNQKEHKNSSSVLSQVYSIPNMITLTRIVSSPFIAIAIANDYKKVVFLGCLAAGISDWLDGYLAKNHNMKTTLGGVLDPLADKIFIGSVTIGLCIKGLIPVPLTALIVGRDVLILCGAIYLRVSEKKSDERFFDFSSHSTFIVSPTYFSKLNTFLQFLLLVTTTSSYMLSYPPIDLLKPLWYITAFSTVISGLGYLDGQGIQRLRDASNNNSNNNDDNDDNSNKNGKNSNKSDIDKNGNNISNSKK